MKKAYQQPGINMMLIGGDEIMSVSLSVNKGMEIEENLSRRGSHTWYEEDNEEDY